MSSNEKETISDYPIKPRRTRGTRSYVIRNRVAAGVLAVGVLFGIGYSFLPSTRRIREHIQRNYSQISEEAKVKKRRLAPFNDPNPDAPHDLPAIFDNAPSAERVRRVMQYSDPLTVRPDQ